MRLELARRRSLSETVLDQLLAQLRSGSVRPGDRLPGEHELTRMLGVGRSSVREALRALITLGLVETRSGRGAVIVARSPNPLARLSTGADVADALQKWAVLDLLEVRESLEGQAAALAAERATPLDLVTIERHALEIERRIEAGLTYFRSNAAFHTAIARASHNNVLAESVQQLVGQVRVYRERLMQEIHGMPSGDIAEHRAVAGAIKNRDPERARAAMVTHIRRFAELVRAFDGQAARVRRSGGSGREGR
jgi:GntR family transcriptional regulator, transcriptional repressor for pyruvate dehydrogenase complex